MPAATPEISVVIPTRGRETRLAFALEALAEQTLGHDRFEVLVVRDPQPGPTAEAPAGMRVRSIPRSPGIGIAEARNAGWRAASAPLVAFTDDDCRPHPGWLEALMRGGRDADTFLQGRTEPDPDEEHLFYGLARSQRIVEPSPWHQTCNMAYPRALLERLGGFDERHVTMCEDTDLGLRAIELGARRRYLEDALVWHAVLVRGLPEALSRARSWDGIPALVARHPGHRRVLYLRCFWKEAHAKLLLALLGVAQFRARPWLALAAALPYLDLRIGHRGWRPRPLARRLATLLSWFPIDATELAVTSRAALRERVLVL